MAGQYPTRRELNEALVRMQDKLDDLSKERAMLQEKLDASQRIIEALQSRLRYYENENAPPSSDSLQYRAVKKSRKEESGRQDRPKGHGRPGGRKGHTGVSRKHNPERTEHHKFDRMGCSGDGGGMVLLPQCSGCGGDTRLDWPVVRDIIEIMPARHEEVRHVTECATCDRCGSSEKADSPGVPGSGSYGPELVGIISEMRSHKITLKEIPTLLHTICGITISASAVSDVMGRTGITLEPEAQRVIEEIQESPSANIDETRISLAGLPGWIWAMCSGPNIFITYHTSRGAHVMDRYMDGYGGVAITDGYSVYRRFDPGGMHQGCWAHILRAARQLCQTASGTIQDDDTNTKARNGLYADLKWIYGYAKDMLERASHSTRLRHSMESMLDSVLERYRNMKGDKNLTRVVKKVGNTLFRLFAFLEHPGVEPTNNAAERALRYAVVFRKISGQIKGGDRAMRAMSAFMTCVLTWRAKGMSVAQEVARLV